MKLLVPALALFALASPAFAQDAAQPAPAADAASSAPMNSAAPAAAPAGGSLPMCGPGVTDRCQQSERAQRMLAANEYKGGGKDNEAMGAGGGGGHGRMMAHHRRHHMR